MKNTRRSTFIINMFLIALLCLNILAVLVMSCVPPVSRDALVHHLAVPKLWIEHGGIYEMPALEFSYYPMSLDLLYLIPLYFGNDIIPKFIHFAFALATAGLIFSYLRRHLDLFFAMLGALFFLSIPIIVKLSITVYVDLGLAFFTTAGILSVFKWHENNYRFQNLGMASLCCGLGLGTKYNGLIVLLLLTVLVAIIAFRAVSQGKYSTPRALLAVMLFVAVAGLIYAPWGIRNILWTGNPVFPLFDSLFNASDPYEIQSVPPLVLRKLMYDETWWETGLLPLRIFFQGQDGSHQYFDGRLNPALLLLPVLGFVISGKDEKARPYQIEKGAMLLFSIVFVLLVFFQTNMRIRYITPAIPCLVILSMFGLHNIALLVTGCFGRKGRRVSCGLVLMAAVLILSGNATYVMQQFNIIRPFQYLDGNISREGYIEKFRPEYAVIRYANTSLPSDARILSLFIGRRGYYSDREMLFDIDMFHAFVKKSRSAEELNAGLAGIGLTHLLIRFDMFQQWSQTNLNGIERQIVANILGNEKSLLFSKNGHGLYRLMGLNEKRTTNS